MLAAETYGYLPEEIEERWAPEDLGEFIAWETLKQKEEAKQYKKARADAKRKTRSR